MSEPLQTWVLLAFLLVLWVVSLVRITQSWRRPIFPIETPEFAAIERALPAFVVTLSVMMLGFTISLFGSPSPWPQPFLSLFLLAFFVSAGLGLSAMMLNWPKAIVPPHRRDDPGLLSSRAFRAASAPMPDLPRWSFGVVAALVLVSLSGVMFLGWPPMILAALALPLVLLGGVRARRR